MLCSAFARRLALLVVAALWPALGFAVNDTYEGALEPENRDPKISIVVELSEFGAGLQGNVKISAPSAYKGDAPIDSGSNVYGKCTVNVDLSRTLSLRMYGDCDPTSFNGTYALVDKQKKMITRGSFRLPRKAPAAVAESPRKTIGSANTAAACLKANTQCLVACPRGDESVEFMCTNHCRTKLRTCKAHIKKTPAEPE